ncbi:MAG: YlxR family protein [Ruminococcaceae bacterium]|nr:YlxR family protein [Oscillospiraceae bacterium]
MKAVHTPIRECISCGGKFPKASLLRIVKDESGIFVDASGKHNGRGAYICHNAGCLEKMMRQRRLNRAFKSPVDDDVYRAVSQILQSFEDNEDK